MPRLSSDNKLLIIGASRGLGFALAEEYLKRGWHVLATERVRTTSQLLNLFTHFCPTCADGEQCATTATTIGSPAGELSAFIRRWVRLPREIFSQFSV